MTPLEVDKNVKTSFLKKSKVRCSGITRYGLLSVRREYVSGGEGADPHENGMSPDREI